MILKLDAMTVIVTILSVGTLITGTLQVISL